MFTIARRLPRAFAAPARFYTVGGRSEGSVAQSKGSFSKKEKAHEDQFIHKHEQEQLAKLRAQIEQQKKALGELEEEHKALESELKK
ncbi:hypothetical protein D9619_009014 [Psilocybe cf. subviscida]|uniref:ATPase inhibitor, mitochondrial n=1 Tax=Psilocybe cf. subviscida TaxID=2480587 RepID=A0A8H5FA07_9AGAR|nr:hypothetical protein D9619_009014 [Psilocybe cf. subviscida]